MYIFCKGEVGCSTWVILRNKKLLCSKDRGSLPNLKLNKPHIYPQAVIMFKWINMFDYVTQRSQPVKLTVILLNIITGCEYYWMDYVFMFHYIKTIYYCRFRTYSLYSQKTQVDQPTQLNKVSILYIGKCILVHLS